MAYVGSRLRVDLLANAIDVKIRMKALSMHGEKSMKERREIMQLSFMGECLGIVATGILGREADSLGVRQVIVSNVPDSI